jgi:hypothetical protein
MMNQAELVNGVVSLVWQTMLAVEPEPTGVQTISGPVVASEVDLTGATGGAVRIRCSQSAAKRIARRFCPSAPQDFAATQDAIGELTNMIAGNIAGVVRQPCRIGVPHAPSAISSVAASNRHGFVADGTEFVVEVVLHESAGVAEAGPDD